MSATSPPVLVRPTPSSTVGGRGRRGAVALDPDQQRAADHPRGAGTLVVLGAPGTGKTTALVEAVAARVERGGADPASLLVLAPSRTAAASLRDRLSARLPLSSTGVPARTPHAYAWSLLRRAAVEAGTEEPRLLSGPEQDHLIADLLRGHAAGDAPPPPWPSSVPPGARSLRAFRAELRDLMMRAMERGLGPSSLARLGEELGRPEWVAAAAVLREYRQVVALAHPGAHDPAAIVVDAARVLAARPELLDAERRRLSLVVVEDHHESTAASAALLDLLVGAGTDLLVVGDPDATTSGFRGGDPSLIAGAAQRHPAADGSASPLVVLGTRWRAGAVLAAPAGALVERIGSSGQVAHRRPRPSPSATGGTFETHVLRSTGAQGAFVASLLRAEHLEEGTPWASMAVVVRSAGASGALRRALAAAGVPVAVPVAEVPLADEGAVRPLLSALRLALVTAAPGEGLGGQDPGGEDPAAHGTPDDVVELLGSWMVGADALAVRRLRQGLLAADRAAGGNRGSDALLVTGVLSPELLASAGARATAPARALARVLAAGRAAAEPTDASAESVLWALWAAAGVAGTWQDAALRGGLAGERADRDLDAVTALFDAASRYEDRLPGSPPGRFLEHLQSQDVPSDTLAARRGGAAAVDLVTAQGAAGREWDVVVVPGLVEGAWPDTRLRGTLLGAPDLADLLAGRGPLAARQETGPALTGARSSIEEAAAARRQVLDDERRLLYVAMTRARRRLVLTAVDDGEERPSSFLDVVAPRERPGEARPVSDVPRASTLPAIVAELRSVLATPLGQVDVCGLVADEDRHARAAGSLARLASAAVPGADPAQWHGLAPLSTDAPLAAGDEPVTVSPSAVETASTCALRWLLGTRSGGREASVSQRVGTLVHQVAQELPDGSADAMTARLEELWPGVGLGETWVGRRELDRARTMVGKLASYVADASAAGRSVAGLEVDVEARLGRALVRGRLDRVEAGPDGALRVVDLKTGQVATPAADVARHAQLGIYQALVEAGAVVLGGAGAEPVDGEQPDEAPDSPAQQPTTSTVTSATAISATTTSAGAALVQLGTGTRSYAEQDQPALSTDLDPGWASTLLEETAEAMAASVFTAVENDGCSSCPVRASCPVQSDLAPGSGS